MVTDEARRLFAVVVNELWHKHPELVVPGWEYKNDEWLAYHPGFCTSSFNDTDILAAAALCAEEMAKACKAGGCGWAPDLVKAIANGPEAVFRFHLDEKGGRA